MFCSQEVGQCGYDYVSRAYKDTQCAPIVCTVPDGVEAYVITAGNKDLSKGAFRETAKCKAGHGQPADAVIATCTTSGDYSLSGCKEKGGRCPHGRLIALAKRKGENHCGECDDGYHWDKPAASCPPANAAGICRCVPWGGDCEHGRPIAVQRRTKAGQCGSCDEGYVLKDGACVAVLCTRPGKAKSLGYELAEGNLDLSAGPFAVTAGHSSRAVLTSALNATGQSRITQSLR